MGNIYIFQNFLTLESMQIITMLLGAFFLGVIFSYTFGVSRRGYTHVSKGIKNKEKDDLQLIQGITPGVEKLLSSAGIQSYQDIISIDVLGLEKILFDGGKRYQKISPVTWHDQANLAANKKWSELEEYQEILLKSQKKTKN